MDLLISETLIRHDDDGRYCLNDLHRASGGAKHHQPAKFLANKSTKALIRELTNQSPNLEIAPVRATHGGSTPSTYVARELVYAYAMWVSAAFALKVIRTYDAFMQAQIDRLNTLSVRRARAEMEYLEAQADASRCGMGLRRWRDERPALEARMEALQIESQPALFMN